MNTQIKSKKYESIDDRAVVWREARCDKDGNMDEMTQAVANQIVSIIYIFLFV